MSRTQLLAALALILSLTCLVPAADDVKDLTVTGAGMTEEEALKDALRKAVEQGAGTYISSQSEVKDFALVRDTVLARAAGFVQEKEILSTRKLLDGTVEVKVRAVVSVKGVVDVWGTVTNMLQQVGQPKIMVFINEKINGKVQDDSVVQTRIANLLLKSGFDLVNKDQIKAIAAKDLAAAVADDNPAKMQAIAKRFGAQLFVTGTANCSAGDVTVTSGIKLYPYQADSNIRCFRSDTGELLASVPGSPTRGVDRVPRSAAQKALDAQAQRVSPEVVNDMLVFWQDVLAGRGEVQLHIEGVSFRDYANIKKKLKTVKGVKNVKTSYHNKVAECSIQADMGAEPLAEKLLDALPELEILDVSQNVIKAKLNADE
jgi:copper chaperone CopZ